MPDDPRTNPANPDQDEQDRDGVHAAEEWDPQNPERREEAAADRDAAEDWRANQDDAA